MFYKIKNRLASLIVEWAIDNKFRVRPFNNVCSAQKLFQVGGWKFVGVSEDSAIVYSVLVGDGSAPKFLENVVFYK